MRDPQRSFRRAIRIAVPVVAIIYLTVVGAFLAAPHSAAALVMPTLLGPGAGEHARALGDVLALMVIGLCTNSLVMCGSRLVLAAARDGLLPSRLAVRSERTGAPTAALLALAAAYMVTIALIAALRLDETGVVTLTTAIFMILYVATAASVLRDRADRATRVCAVLTGGFALCMLPFTGLAAPVAGSLTIALAIAIAAKRRQRVLKRTLWRTIRISPKRGPLRPAAGSAVAASPLLTAATLWTSPHGAHATAQPRLLRRRQPATVNTTTRSEPCVYRVVCGK